MMKFIRNFAIYFPCLLLANILVNLLTKSGAYFLTACSTALGVSIGILLLQLYQRRHSKKNHTNM